MRIPRALARFGTPLVLAGMALTFTRPLHGVGELGAAGLALIVTGLTLVLLPTRPAGRAPVPLRSPVEGRWVPVNSPADRVPSHGTHELGQTHAIDLVHAPDPDAEWRPVRPGVVGARAEAFPAFGRPVHAPAGGVVVAASGWQRDHRARNTWPGLLYLLVEGMVFRSLLSLATLSAGRFVLGNHVILDLGDGVYAVLAHLRRGSVRVRRGERVAAGEVLGEVGNSGNSSEPHLHFHLMDRARPMLSQGVPFAFGYLDDDGARHTGVPGGRRPFTAPAADAARRDAAQEAGAQPGIG
ncbi:M23 family metallopeptidase [Actinomadura kijaniata]|uniref:M23 family metallopeptidase n=1 Tax=Actinomadura kijaniata TaxID=46161 RepID=UPI003F1DF802